MTSQTNFRNIVEPYLRDVQAKRGITDFVVICDDTNNTPDVIDANEFKVDIFIKPARSHQLHRSDLCCYQNALRLKR